VAYYERRRTLHSVLERSNAQLQSAQTALSFGATRKTTLASTTVNTSTPSVTVVSEYEMCVEGSVLEVYAHGLGTTNGAGKYGVLVVYIDGVKMYADTLLKWGDSAAAVSSERRFSVPGSAIGTGNPNANRLGGFVVVMDTGTDLLSAGSHLIEIKLETSGSSASCIVTDLAVTYRIS